MLNLTNSGCTWHKMAHSVNLKDFLVNYSLHHPSLLHTDHSLNWDCDASSNQQHISLGQVAQVASIPTKSFYIGSKTSSSI